MSFLLLNAMERDVEMKRISACGTCLFDPAGRAAADTEDGRSLKADPSPKAEPSKAGEDGALADAKLNGVLDVSADERFEEEDKTKRLEWKFDTPCKKPMGPPPLPFKLLPQHQRHQRT